VFRAQNVCGCCGARRASGGAGGGDLARRATPITAARVAPARPGPAGRAAPTGAGSARPGSVPITARGAGEAMRGKGPRGGHGKSRAGSHRSWGRRARQVAAPAAPRAGPCSNGHGARVRVRAGRALGGARTWRGAHWAGLGQSAGHVRASAGGGRGAGCRRRRRPEARRRRARPGRRRRRRRRRPRPRRRPRRWLRARAATRPSRSRACCRPRCRRRRRCRRPSPACSWGARQQGGGRARARERGRRLAAGSAPRATSPRTPTHPGRAPAPPQPAKPLPSSGNLAIPTHHSSAYSPPSISSSWLWVCPPFPAQQGSSPPSHPLTTPPPTTARRTARPRSPAAGCGCPSRSPARPAARRSGRRRRWWKAGARR
jgi:hypothetical protein